MNTTTTIKAFAVIRKNTEKDHEWIDLDTVRFLPEKAKQEADKTDKMLAGSNWSSAHPQQRTVRIEIREVE